MGNQHSKKHKKHKDKDDRSNSNSQLSSALNPPKFHAFKDQYETIEQVQDALQQAGLESSNLIIAIDYTISNESSGKKTFGGKSLHSLTDGENPYQSCIRILGRTLEIFDDDKLIPVFGFGDSTTQEKSVFPFYPDKPCHTFNEVLSRYNEITPHIKMAGPTSFAPIIKQAVEIVRSNGGTYHILVIIADGQITPDSDWNKCETETRQAIVHASQYPLSIIVVGVGDGPWDMMEEFDDKLPERAFDNFQFVDFYSTRSNRQEYQDANFALAALQEIPEQYSAIKQLRLLGKD